MTTPEVIRPRGPAYPPSAQASLMDGKARRRFHSSGFAASRSCTDAAVTRTVRSRPIVSTAMCRLVVDLLARVVAAAGPADHLRALHRLGIDNRGRRGCRP